MPAQITHATPAAQAAADQAATERSTRRAPGPDLAMYRAVHAAIRQAAHRLADAAASLDPDGTGRAEAGARAWARYWAGYAGEVVAHHTVEDEVFFPALRERAPSAVAMTDRTDADHAHLDELLERCGQAIGRLGAPGGTVEAVAALRALAAHMDEHLDFEDAEMLPLIEQVFTEDEYDALEKQALAIVGSGKQALFTVPFIADSMHPQQRAVTLREAPLPMRIVYRLGRRGFARTSARVFGAAARKAVA